MIGPSVASSDRYTCSGARAIVGVPFRVAGAVSVGPTVPFFLAVVEQSPDRVLAGALVHAVAAAHGYGGWLRLAHQPSDERPAENFRARYICYKLREIGLASRGDGLAVRGDPGTSGRASKR